MSNIELIQIEPTTKCNFSCSFCPGRYMEQGAMDYNLFLKILNDHSEIFYLQLYGEGEPLMHPDFFSMVKRAEDKKIKVSTITNGSLLNIENIEKLIAARLDSIHISLESTIPDTFHKLRGGNLKKIISNIKLLMKIRNEKKSAIPFVGFSVTILQETKNDLDQIFRLYQDLALDGGIVFQPLNEMISYKNNYNDEINSQALDDANLKDINQELENNKTLEEIVKNRCLELNYFQALRQNFHPEQDGCPWLKRSLFVNIQGYAMPCSMIKDINLYSFGHIGEDSKESILEKREKMKNQLLSGNIPKACYKCRTLDSYYKPGKMYQYLNRRKRI